MDVGNDREIIEKLTEVISGQKYLTVSIDEFKKEMNEFKKEIREKVDSHGDEIKDMKSDIRFLKDSTSNNTKDIKVLQDERTVNIMTLQKNSMPNIIKYGIVAAIFIAGICMFLTFNQGFNQLQNIINTQQQQLQQMKTGGNP